MLHEVHGTTKYGWGVGSLGDTRKLPMNNSRSPTVSGVGFLSGKEPAEIYPSVLLPDPSAELPLSVIVTDALKPRLVVFATASVGHLLPGASKTEVVRFVVSAVAVCVINLIPIRDAPMNVHVGQTVDCVRSPTNHNSLVVISSGAADVFWEDVLGQWTTAMERPGVWVVEEVLFQELLGGKGESFCFHGYCIPPWRDPDNNYCTRGPRYLGSMLTIRFSENFYNW